MAVGCVSRVSDRGRGFRTIASSLGPNFSGRKPETNGTLSRHPVVRPVSVKGECVRNAAILFAVGTYVEFYVALDERSPWSTLFFAAILAFLSYAAASRPAQRDWNWAHFKLVRRAVAH